MKEDSGSGNLRRPYGCLIVKKKSDGVISNGVSLGNSKERKRPRLILSDSDSDPPPPNVASHASDVPVVRNCNSDSFERREEHEIDRKRKPGPIVYRDGARIDRNTFLEAGIERKRSRMDDIAVEERRTEIGRNGVLISKTRPPISRGKEYEGDSSRSIPVENRGHSLFDRSSNFPVQQKEAICMDRQRFEMKTDRNIRPGLLKRKFEVHHGKPIRVQGKNGVLKVMPRNENKVGAPKRFFNPKKEEENIKGSGVGASERFFSPKKEDNRQGSGVGASYKIFSPKMEEENRKCFGVRASEKLFRSKKEEEEEYRKGSGVGAPKVLFSPKKEENQKASGSAHYSNGKAPLSPPLYSENKSREKLHSASVADKKQVNLPKKLSTKHKEVRDQRTQVSETALSQDSKGVVSCSSKKEVSKKQRTLSSEPCTSIRHKEGEVKRGNGTEKQILREQIRQMLVNAGWTIDLRPRKNRDYQDSVYVSPSGTEYWSITKAYYAFQKHFEDEGRNQKHTGDLSSVTLIPEDVLSKLTRQTRKKIEREMKMQQKGGRGSKKAKETSEKKINNKHVKVKLDSVMNGENMNTNVTQDGNSPKVRIKGNSVVGPDTDDLAKHKKSTLDKAGYGNGEKKKQSGRALLVRNSSKGLNMEDDDFVPYTGKRTVLSWLIDMETVRLSGKVQYMNKKRTRAMLEGWITRDGIHCRCCSKILTVSKFELHAGSKLHHPFQNIIVETGVSLYQCQLDAWNKQDKCVRRGFHFIDVDGDDPNDDTCGICGDGGDLICCDGCPSTFHQSCLDIQMLPSGDWLCPNCSCKFCGGVDGCTDQKEDATLCSCSLCEEKYHRQCRQHADTISIGSDNLRYSFCGKACEKLFQKLQKLLGVKHELEAGFSWTLIQRSNLDSDASSREQCPKAECNSKIAVALTVMDECFLPVIDQRSGVNLIHNVVFNIGSNFNRVNYSGFYTAILERGDEIISAASIRIHGTRLAEMPFIGTRHTYRRQGMCRRLLNAIESALSSLSVEKLVIPAISELMHTWTTVFGFKSLEELHRQEVKTLNMLVFPSTDLLQKPLLKHKLNEVDVTESSEVDKAIEHDGNKHIMPERSDNTDIGSVEPDTCALVKRAVCDPRMNNGVSFIETDHLSSGASTYDTSDMIKNPSVASLGTIPNGPSDCSAPDTNVTPHADVNHEKNLDVGTNAICKSSLESELHNSTEDDPHRVNVVAAAAVEIDLHSLDETSAKDTITNNVEGSVIDTSDGFQRTDRIVQSNSDRIERNVPKVECKADLCSVYSGICPPDKGAVYNCEMSCAVASSGTGLQGPVGSIYDTSDMTIKPLDSAVGSIPDDHSEEYAHDTQFFLQHINHGVETKSILGSSVESKLEDTKDDAHEVKVEAASVLDLHPFDVTPGQDISSIHDYPNAFSGNSRMSGNHVRNNYNLNEHNVQKMECGSEMVSFEHGICTGEKNAVCDPKVNNGVTSFGTGSSGSTTSDMKGNPSYLALKPIPEALSAESVLQSKNPFPCINHETKLNVEMISSVDCKLQSSAEDGVLEAASSEHTNTDSSYPNAISGNKFWCTGGKRVEKGSDLNEHYIHSMGCASVEVFHDTSDVDYYKVDGLSNSEESTKQDASEVRAEVSAVASDLFPFSECRVTSDGINRDVSEMKTEASAVESDLLPSDEGHVHRQLRFAAVGNTCQGSSENILCHDPALTGLSYGRVSDNNYPNSGGKLAHHRDFQLLQNVQDGSNSATGEATISCEVGNGVAPDRYKPQELVEDMMDSTSEVSGTIW